MRRFLLTLGSNDFLCLLYSNFCENRIIFENGQRSFTDFKHYFISKKFCIVNYKHEISIVSKVNKNRQYHNPNIITNDSC